VDTNAALVQARRMIKVVIEENPTQAQLSRQATVDNGYGQLVPDPYGAASIVKARLRIAPLPYGAAKVAAPSVTDAGVTTTDRQFAMGAHNADMRAGDTLQYNGSTWVLGPVIEIVKFGGVVARQSPMRKADDVEVTT